jgi:hypothetical protein
VLLARRGAATRRPVRGGQVACAWHDAHAHRGLVMMLFRFSASTSDALSRPCERHAMPRPSSPGSVSAGKPRWKEKVCGIAARGATRLRGGERRSGAARTRSGAAGTLHSAARAASMQRRARRERAMRDGDSALLPIRVRVGESKGRAERRLCPRSSSPPPRARSTARAMRRRSRCARVAPPRARPRSTRIFFIIAIVAASRSAAGAAEAPPAAGDANASATAALSHEALARAALAEALLSLGTQLDACGGADDAGAADVAAYMSGSGGMTRIAEDVRDIAAAARRGAISSDDIAAASAAPPANTTAAPAFALWSTHSVAASEALRERMQELGHHLKFVRALVMPCVMRSPDDAPPDAEGAWALNAWLRGAREALETRRGCLARRGVGAAATAHACGSCARAVGIATATTFVGTAAAAAALGAVLRRRAAPPWAAAAPRRRLRGAAALGMTASSPGGGDADAALLINKKRHSLSGPELPRPYGAVPAPSRSGAPV